MCSFCALRLSFTSLVAEDQASESEGIAGVVEVTAGAQGDVGAERRTADPPATKLGSSAD